MGSEGYASGAGHEDQPVNQTDITGAYADDESAEGGQAAEAGAGGAGAAGAGAAGEDKVAELEDTLARTRADMYNLQQEYNAFVRRSRSEAGAHREAGAAALVEALFGVLDEIELARQHGDLTGPFQSIAEKLEEVLRQRHEVERFGATGDEFDPEKHEALMARDDDSVEVQTVGEVIQPGYTFGGKVLRPARVAVRNPA